MKRKLIVLSALICLALSVMAFANGLAGNWKGIVRNDQGQEFPIAYHFKVNGMQLTGTVDSPNGTLDIQDGKVNGRNFTFKVLDNEGDYLHAGTLYADYCGMDIQAGNARLHAHVLRDTSKN